MERRIRLSNETSKFPRTFQNLSTREDPFEGINFTVKSFPSWERDERKISTPASKSRRERTRKNLKTNSDSSIPFRLVSKSRFSPARYQRFFRDPSSKNAHLPRDPLFLYRRGASPSSRLSVSRPAILKRRFHFPGEYLLLASRSRFVHSRDPIRPGWLGSRHLECNVSLRVTWKPSSFPPFTSRFSSPQSASPRLGGTNQRPS